VEPIGLPALAALAAQLYGPPGPDAARRLLAPVTRVEPLRVESDPAGGGGYTLRLPLPLVERSDLDLGRRGDDLVVSVAGARRVLRLPSALRRCEITGAALRSGSLSVGFRPDPALWPRP
jgi:arsenite-transporting ATPase